MKSILSALTIAVLAVGTVGTAPASAAVETVSLGSKEETAPEPAPFFEATVTAPVSFKVTYTATPVQPLEIGATLNCIRGSETPGNPEKPETVTPPASITLIAPPNSDSCLLTAVVEPAVMTTVFGTVRIEAEAVRRVSEPESAPPPAKKKKKCRKGARLKHGKCVKKGKKQHPHRH